MLIRYGTDAEKKPVKKADIYTAEDHHIDPGLIGLANLVLASTKNYAHRLYLGEGIYGEVSMIYENRTFVPLKWTYPDYYIEESIDFFLRVRESLKEFIIELRRQAK